jgi:cyanoexosortase A
MKASDCATALRTRLVELWRRVPEAQRHWLASQIPAIPPATPRNLWLLLAAAVATQNVAVLTSSQNAHVGVYALLVWGGALICMEDQIEALEPRPTRWGLVLGSVLILWVIARTGRILFWEGILYLLAPLAGFALALLCMPLREIGKLRETLICLWLLPGFAAIMRTLPEKPLSLLTAQIAGFWVSTLGVQVAVDGRKVFMMPVGGVTVLGGCNGLDMISQILCVALIFLMAFPIRSKLSRAIVLLIAPLVGLLCNTIRIALLAMITTTGQGTGDPVFEFFHTDMGSLIFSGVAVFLFGMIYMWLLERELPPLEGTRS